jgi:DNA-binding CsgD family transcriptional regulator
MPTPQYADLPQRLTLTRREVEVMALLCDAGLDYGAIALQLNISEQTLKKHRENIYFKLGVSNRFQAVEVYRNSGE